MPAMPARAAEPASTVRAVSNGVVLRSLDGSDEMLLAEFPGPAVGAAIALIDRLAGGAIEAASLPVGEFERLLLRLYVDRFGNDMLLGFACRACRGIAEVAFRVSDLVAAARPRRDAGVAADAERAGWFRIGEAAAGEASFRLPTAGDQAAAAAAPDPYRHVCDACLDAVAKTPPWRARVEHAMAIMAPLLSRTVSGRCPSCGAEVRAWLSISEIVIAELKRAAGRVHDDVDLIARAYHWPEPHILALPEPRRRAYAERIRKAA